MSTIYHHNGIINESMFHLISDLMAHCRGYFPRNIPAFSLNLSLIRNKSCPSGSPVGLISPAVIDRFCPICGVLFVTSHCRLSANHQSNEQILSHRIYTCNLMIIRNLILREMGFIVDFCWPQTLQCAVVIVLPVGRLL